MVLVSAYTWAPSVPVVRHILPAQFVVHDDITPAWQKRQTEILDHIGKHLEQLHKDRDCSAAATTFEELLKCHPAATDTSLCGW